MIISTALVLLVTSLILYTLRIAYGRRKYSHIKSPPLNGVLYFIPGHAHDVGWYLKQNPTRMYSDYLRECFDEVGDMTMVLHAYQNSEVWMIDVSKAALILSNNNQFRKSVVTQSLLENFCGVRLLGKHNLVFSPGGDIWQTKRKIMDASFHRTALKQTYGGMQTASNNLIENLERVRKDGEIVNIYEFLVGATLEVITRTGFSIDEDVKETGVTDRIENIFVALGRAYEMDLSFILPWSARTVKAKINKNIKSTREYLAKHLMMRIENVEDMKSKDDILAHIIKANLSIEGFNAEEIIDDFFAFLIAGMETTSSSMSFFLMVMIRNPEIFAKVREEVDMVYDGRTELEYEDLNKLEYLEQCIRETMRLYSVAEDTTREAMESVTIGGMYLPKGTIINISQAIIHRHPVYWGDDADLFNPENFRPGTTIKPFTYMPFMAGPRACIGKYFAMMEMKIILSKVVLNFELYNPNERGPERIRCKSDMTQRPLEGVPVMIKRR